VEIIDDELRINFARWLELADWKLQEARMDPDSKIIIILDGLDNFIDPESGFEESADWLPWTFPNSVRFIITCRKSAKGMNHFKERKYPLLFVENMRK